MIVRRVTACLVALLLTGASAWVPLQSDERAKYGAEGAEDENWLTRELAGWPAPYLADNPNTSVIHNVGLEDDFRFGPFIATLSFWLLVSLVAIRFASALVRKGRLGHRAGKTRTCDYGA